MQIRTTVDKETETDLIRLKILPASRLLKRRPIVKLSAISYALPFLNVTKGLINRLYNAIACIFRKLILVSDDEDEATEGCCFRPNRPARISMLQIEDLIRSHSFYPPALIDTAADPPPQTRNPIHRHHADRRQLQY